MSNERPALSLPPGLDEQDLAGLMARHASHARLCAQLEAAADRLPERPDAGEEQALCQGLAAYQAELAANIDRLQSGLLGVEHHRPIAQTLISHIATRHNAAAATADDLIVAIGSRDGECRPLCAEALGFMLRSFFDTCRYALAMEEIAILLIAGDRLSEGARALLEQRLAMMR